MNIFKLFFELFVLYLVYKLVFEFIIPVYNTTRQVKQKMDAMQQQMRQQQQTESTRNQYSKPENSVPVSKPAAEDYIDYEEIR